MPGKLLRRAAIAGVLLGAAGCTPRPDALVVDPRVQPVRVELRRSFGVFRRHDEPVALSECGFYEWAASAEGPRRPYPEEIWRVVSSSSSAAVPALRYGVVPPGFVQATPAGAAAPPLQPGHRYIVECSGDAVGSAEFEIPERVTRPAPPLQRSPD
ncbi:MAG: hypothetical protein HYY35_09325 [Deltaproteobacteria bacterium]|nr:hypothetical protein [Deltaproteobacteria bacterium]